MKHFNAGNVWGKIATIERKKSDGQKVYAAIAVECSGSQGAVRIFGRLWGESKVDEIIEWHKKNPGETVRLRGFFSQYEKDGDILSNYTWFAFAPAPGQEYRAAFILVGEVMAINDETLSLHLHREGAAGYDDTEEDFLLYFEDPAPAAGVELGATVKIKGTVRQAGGEDFFGDSGETPARPTIYSITTDIPF